MNVFDLRDLLIEDYQRYIASFIHIKDSRIKEYVDRELEGGLLWPDPLIQLNPAFEPGHWVDELVDELIAANEALKEEMEKIRLALGMDRYDFDKFRRDGFIAQAQSDVVGQAIECLVGKLEKVLGHE